MSDDEFERLKRRKLLQLTHRFLAKSEEKQDKVSKNGLLKKVFVGRAWEVFNATKSQYPQVAGRLEDVLVQLVSSGRIKRITGEELYHLLRKIGLRVRLKTTIRFKEHGKLKSIGDKMKEQNRY